MTPTCHIDGCSQPAIANTMRCRHHRHRGRCIVDNCSNQVYARNLCCRHGAKKQCQFEGCTLRARLGNVCYKHGADKKQCNEPGCTQPAQARHKCVKHGGGRKCKATDCVAHARAGGYCQRHRAALAPKPIKQNINMGALWGDHHHPRHDSIDSSDDVSEIGTVLKQDQALMVHLDGFDFSLGADEVDMPVDPFHIEDKSMLHDILCILDRL
ncbi:hypothetical protein DYB32_008384 [Aphanomyces invadans]|uniref:WRKY transcription factor 19 n=1 Tax=Aphanomyces invadans TaxID=157072 RepID=A0A418AL60_9STRA|nr:hypothetical protein DYB32_008384 [Aphanomyces invadans]